MNFTSFRSRSFSSTLAIVALTASAGWSLAACSDDDDGADDDGYDSGAGGTQGYGGKGAGGGSKGGAGGKISTGGAGGGSGGGANPDAGDGAVGSDGGDAGPGGLVRIVHVAAGAPAVDLYLKGATTPFAEDVAYGDATPYVDFAAGDIEIELRAAGDPYTADPVFTTPVIAVEGGERYTALAAGDIESTEAATRFRVLAYEEAFDAASAGTVRARIVHASYDSPAVDVDIDDDSPADPEIEAIAPFGDSGAAGVELPVDTSVQIGVVASGLRITAFTIPEIPAGDGVFLIAAGKLSEYARNPLGLSTLAVLPDSSTVWIRQNPRIYTLHASPDAGNVDVYVGNREVVDNAAFGKLSTFQVPPGTATFDIFAGYAGATPRPAGAPVVSGTTPELDAGVSHLAVLAGALTGVKTFELITLPENFDLSVNTGARIRVVHASADSPEIDVGAVTVPGTLVTPPLVTGLEFGDASAAAGLSVPAGDLTIGLAATGSTDTAAEFDVTTAVNDKSFVVAAGRYAGTPNPLQLIVVNTAAPVWEAVAVPSN